MHNIEQKKEFIQRTLNLISQGLNDLNKLLDELFVVIRNEYDDDEDTTITISSTDESLPDLTIPRRRRRRRMGKRMRRR